MPNHVTSILHFNCGAELQKRIYEAIKDDEAGIGSVDFNKLIPMPPSLDVESGSTSNHGLKVYQAFIEWYNDKTSGENKDLLNIPSEYLNEYYNTILSEEDKEYWNIGKTVFENIQKYGAPTWYEWRIRNWGTKWNAYDFGGIEPDTIPDSLSFNTAWSAPHKVIEKIAELYPEALITHEWADEDIGCNCGRKEYKNGECVSTYYPDYGCESIEFAAGVLECDLEDLGMKLSADKSTYVSITWQDYDLVEFDNVTMLLADEILRKNNIPEGLYIYYLKEKENGCCIVDPEKITAIGFDKTLISKTPMDFGRSSYREYDKSNPLKKLSNKRFSFEDYIELRDNPSIAQSSESQKPDCPLIGQDGNIYNLVGIASKTLQKNGFREQAIEMRNRVFNSKSYDDALCIIGEYVNITSANENEDADENEEQTLKM